MCLAIWNIVKAILLEVSCQGLLLITSGQLWIGLKLITDARCSDISKDEWQIVIVSTEYWVGELQHTLKSTRVCDKSFSLLVRFIPSLTGVVFAFNKIMHKPVVVILLIYK